MLVFTDLNIVPCFGAFVKGKMRVYGEFAKKIMGENFPPWLYRIMLISRQILRSVRVCQTQSMLPLPS